MKNWRNPSDFFILSTYCHNSDFKCTLFSIGVSNICPSKPKRTKGLIFFFIGAEANLIYHTDMVEYNSYILTNLTYLKCTLFFPLGWKFCVSNVLWNWSLRLETRPELQFKRSKITPRKRHLFVPRSGSLQFFPFIFTSVTNSLSQTNLLVSWNQYLYEVCTYYLLIFLA